MEPHDIVITEADYTKLKRLVESEIRPRSAEHLEVLQQELDRAVIVKSADVPRDVVTMNSRARLRDLDSGQEFVYQIVFPQNANLEMNRISILAPIGVALLGYRAGSTVEWKVPSGTRRLLILDVEYQPEAAAANRDQS